MTAPKIMPCPKCGEKDLPMYGYGEWGTTWRVECDDCYYMGPGGNKMQAIRGHNDIARAALDTTNASAADALQPPSQEARS